MKSNFLGFILFSSMLCSSSFFAFSQEQGSEDRFSTTSYIDINPMHSFTMELGMPVIMANKFNKKYMSGLVYFSPYYQFSMENHLSLGAGAFYTLTNINSVATSEDIKGGNNILGGFFKISYEKFHNTRFGTDMGVKLGYAESIYTTNTLKKEGRKSTDNGFYIEPNLGFVLTVSEKSSFRLFVGYQVMGMLFDNKKIAMESDGGMDSKSFKKVQQHLIFGFGYTFYAKTR